MDASDYINRAEELFGKDTPNHGGNGSGDRRLDVGTYLAFHGINFKVKDNGTKTIYALNHCLFDESHVNNDAAVMQDADGKLSYHCFHDSCQGYGWKDARAKISGDVSLGAFMIGGNDGKKKEPIEWPEPIPIKAELLPVEPLHDEMIPRPFLPMIQDASHRMSIPMDFIAVPIIIVAGSVIGTACRIKPKKHDDWAVVPNLWGGIMGPPSRLKTPALDEVMKKLLGRLESEERDKHSEKKTEWIKDQRLRELSKSVLESEYKKALKSEREGENKGKASNAIFCEIQGLSDNTEPAERRFKTNDCTIEKMTELLSNNAPRGILYFRDELIGLFKRMDRPGYEQDRAFLIESFNGNGEYTADRVGRGTVTAKNLCISLLGSIQPGKAVSYLRQAISSDENDGFFQRQQMMVFPDMPKFEYRDKWPDTDSKNRCYEIIRALAYMDFKGDPFDEDDAGPFLRFDDEAQVIFEQWFLELQSKLENEDEHPALIEHMGKYRGLMPSLALIFHLVEVADGTGQGRVSKRCAIQAAAWCEYLESHARRIYGMVLNGTAMAAAVLAKKLRSGQVDSPFKVRDIQRKGWSRLQVNSEIRDAVVYLVDAGWLRELEPDVKRFGRPSDAEYEINPRIFSEIP